MNTLAWIVLGGVVMSAIAMVGSLTLVLNPATLNRLLLPLVALAAGSLIGGAFFHMIPAALDGGGPSLGIGIAVVAGFTVFFLLEQVLHWHHCHRAKSECKQPLTYLVLLGDGLHNFLGGLAIAGTFLIDVRLGITSWFAAAAHEVPQELGDFGVLVHGGWSKNQALLLNLLSGLTFLLGGDDVGFEVMVPVHFRDQIRSADVEEVSRRKRNQPAHVHLKRESVRQQASCSAVVR